MQRRPAFVLLGGFGVVGRNGLYIEELRRRGLDVLLITPSSWRDEALAGIADPGHVAHQIADVAFVDGSIGTPESFTPDVLAGAMDWRASYDVRGVYALGEVLVVQAGILADALGLPSPGLRATRAGRSKPLQRWYLPEWSPPSRVVSPGRRGSLAASDLPYPVVVKPASRHSSSGVRSCSSADELLAALDGYPGHETLLVEDRVVGQEFSVESLVQHGEVLFESVTRKETTGSHTATFVELSHSVPSRPAPVDATLVQQTRGVLRRLDFRDGIAHAEWRVTPDGLPVLMEVAVRTPGDGLLPLYELATGSPLEPEIMRICLGEPAAYPAPRRYTRQVYLEHPEGRLDDVRVDIAGVPVHWVGETGVWPRLRPGGPGDPPALRAVLVLHDRGAVLNRLTESDDRAVTFLIDAATPDELDEFEKTARAAIHVDVTST